MICNLSIRTSKVQKTKPKSSHSFLLLYFLKIGYKKYINNNLIITRVLLSAKETSPALVNFCSFFHPHDLNTNIPISNFK